MYQICTFSAGLILFMTKTHRFVLAHTAFSRAYKINSVKSLYRLTCLHTNAQTHTHIATHGHCFFGSVLFTLSLSPQCLTSAVLQQYWSTTLLTQSLNIQYNAWCSVIGCNMQTAWFSGRCYWLVAVATVGLSKRGSSFLASIIHSVHLSSLPSFSSKRSTRKCFVFHLQCMIWATETVYITKQIPRNELQFVSPLNSQNPMGSSLVSLSAHWLSN